MARFGLHVGHVHPVIPEPGIQTDNDTSSSNANNSSRDWDKCEEETRFSMWKHGKRKHPSQWGTFATFSTFQIFFVERDNNLRRRFFILHLSVPSVFRV